jgi:hypothetical protein
MGGGGREAIERDLKKLRAEREDLDDRIRLLVPAGVHVSCIHVCHHKFRQVSTIDYKKP